MACQDGYGLDIVACQYISGVIMWPVRYCGLDIVACQESSWGDIVTSQDGCGGLSV